MSVKVKCKKENNKYSANTMALNLLIVQTSDFYAENSYGKKRTKKKSKERCSTGQFSLFSSVSVCVYCVTVCASNRS